MAIKRKNESSTIQNKSFENDINEQKKNDAGKILKSKAKRAVTNQAYNEVKHELDKQDAGERIAAAIEGKMGQIRYNKVVHKLNGANRLEKEQKQNAFNSFKDTLEVHKDWKYTFKPWIKTGDPNLKLSQITPLEEAIKNDFKNNKAAKILQAAAKRKVNEKTIIKKIENAGDILGGVKKERAAHTIKAIANAKLTYQFKDAVKDHQSKYTGKPLVVLKNTKELILKSRHDRGVKAAQTRKAVNELKDKYKDIMQKPFKKSSEKIYKGKNRFNPL